MYVNYSSSQCCVTTKRSHCSGLQCSQINVPICYDGKPANGFCCGVGHCDSFCCNCIGGCR